MTLNVHSKKSTSAIAGFIFGVLVLFSSIVNLSAQSAIGTVVTLTGYVLNGNTLMPVEAHYALYDATGKKVGQSHTANANDGYLVTGLRSGEQYVIKVEDPRYLKQEFKVDVPKTSKYAEISKDFVVRPMEVGKKIAVQPAPFDLKKTTIKVGTEQDMDELARLMIVNPGVNVDLICYPDDNGTADAIQQLSAARGASLKAFLTKNGVSAQRISVRNATSTDPINPPPLRKAAKGKRYVGPVYLVITKV